MSTEPIIVTDTDDLRRAFAMHLAGFLGLPPHSDIPERVAASLIEIMLAKYPPAGPRIADVWSHRWDGEDG